MLETGVWILQILAFQLLSFRIYLSVWSGINFLTAHSLEDWTEWNVLINCAELKALDWWKNSIHPTNCRDLNTHTSPLPALYDNCFDQKHNHELVRWRVSSCGSKKCSIVESFHSRVRERKRAVQCFFNTSVFTGGACQLCLALQALVRFIS